MFDNVVIADYNGYKLTKGQYNDGEVYYRVIQNENSRKFARLGAILDRYPDATDTEMLTVAPNHKEIGVRILYFSDNSLDFVSSYIDVLKEAFEAAKYFNSVIAKHEGGIV